MAKSQFSTLAKLARHYGIFEHMFEKKEFMPTVGMSVTFGETDHVHYGNFLTPSQVWNRQVNRLVYKFIITIIIITFTHFRCNSNNYLHAVLNLFLFSYVFC